MKEIKELTLPISKLAGALWLLAGVLIIFYGFMQFKSSKYAWTIGILAIVLSQILLIIFWKDAKFGTIPNIIILVVTIMGYGNYRFNQVVKQEREVLFIQNGDITEKLVSKDDIQHLPKAVKNWVQSSGIIGKPFVHVGKIEQRAWMKLKPEQEKWFSAEAVQYTYTQSPSFIWSVHVKMNDLIYFQGRDIFTKGKGQMLIKLNSLFSIVNEAGTRIDEGTMQRFLGELVWFPTLAISPYITWKEIDEFTCEATMEYLGGKASGTFQFNADGDFIQYSTMRYLGNDKDEERKEWVLSVEEYRSFEGVRIPSKMRATWILDEGPWTWLKLEIKTLNYNPSD